MRSPLDLLVTQERLLELRDMIDAEGLEQDAPFELSCREMLQLLNHIDILGAALDVEAGDYCRVCGCTENTPCEPPCGWDSEGLCTSCAGEDLEETPRCPGCVDTPRHCAECLEEAAGEDLDGPDIVVLTLDQVADGALFEVLGEEVEHG